MGGSSSTVSISDSSTLQSSIMLSTASACITDAGGGNVLNIVGNYNDVIDMDQTVVLQFNSNNCSITSDENANFSSSVADAIASSLQSTTQEGLGWLDDTRTSQSETITSLVTSSVNVTNTQQCLSNISEANDLNIQGDYNYLAGDVQNASVQYMSNCVLSNSSGATASNVLSNNSNLTTQYTSANFFTPLMDAVEAAFADFTIMIFLIVLIIGALIAAYKWEEYSNSTKRDVKNE